MKNEKVAMEIYTRLTETEQLLKQAMNIYTDIKRLIKDINDKPEDKVIKVQNNNFDELMTTQQAAEFLGLKPSTLHVWKCTKRYNLPSIKVGRLVKYKKADLLQFIENNSKDFSQYKTD